MSGPAIRIVTSPAGSRIEYCAIPNVQDLLIGLPADKVGQALRRLHGICREAQGLVGEMAVAAAMGQSTAPTRWTGASRAFMPKPGARRVCACVSIGRR
jgi:hypothetical protein